MACVVYNNTVIFNDNDIKKFAVHLKDAAIQNVTIIFQETNLDTLLPRIKDFMIEKTLRISRTLPIGYVTIGVVYSPNNGKFKWPAKYVPT